jgi:hypothetical protein
MILEGYEEDQQKNPDLLDVPNANSLPKASAKSL